MKQKPPKSSVKTVAKKPLPARKPSEPKLNLIYALLLLGYGFITVLTPNLYTLDSLGPKFYTLSILNLVAYIIILIGNHVNPQQDFHWSFFRTWTGVIYTLFLLVSLLSFFKAFNIYESIINFSKIFTIFSAAYIVSIILRQDKRYLYVISISLAFLLIFDSGTVFYHIILNKLDGKAINISEIKSVYSNKNILASAIFVKIAFVIWLLTFGKGWMKVVGGFTLLIALVAILFMSTRTFFIGSIFVAIIYGVFMIIRFYKKNEKRRIIFGAMYLLAAVIVVFLAFSIALKYLYPDSKQSGYTVFIERLKTLSGEQGGLRAQSWQNSFKLIKANPWLGIGTGNWKVEVLKYETPTTGAYIYMYKNHNDFIETTADTGIFGGVLFLGIFILIFANFIRAFFKSRKGEEESYKWLFLPAFGLFCYSFDAMFNFPSDRPEIISFFAIFVGSGIAFSPPISFFKRKAQNALAPERPNAITPNAITQNAERPNAKRQNAKTQNAERQNAKTQNAERQNAKTQNAERVALASLFIALMLGSIYIFYLNFVSLKLQRVAKQELNAGTLTSKSEVFLNGFPAIPDINIEGEPIAVSKSRYLITEEKYQQAIDLLKKDNSSPYDTRQEFFIGMAYLKMNQPDSALVYADKVYRLKPYFSGNISVMSSAYEMKGNLVKALKVLDDHMELNSKNSQPVSEIIYQQQASLTTRVKIQQNQEQFNNGLESFNRKDYDKAIKYFSAFIDREQGVAQVFEYRAFCYFYLKKYQLSLNDINKAIALDATKPGYINLRGVDQQMLGNVPAACADFQTAINMGDKDAKNNYEKFCKKK